MTREEAIKMLKEQHSINNHIKHDADVTEAEPDNVFPLKRTKACWCSNRNDYYSGGYDCVFF